MVRKDPQSHVWLMERRYFLLLLLAIFAVLFSVMDLLAKVREAIDQEAARE